jgi:multicomponent Na+:H+ antiporter subunit B
VRRSTRLVVFLFAAAIVAALFVAAVLDLPRFGTSVHPYRTLALAATVAHQTANAVGAVTFDQRGIDTLVEESILLGSVVGVAALLRPARGEEERQVPETGRLLASTQLLGYVMLPVTAVVGIDVIVHGHLTPGGGFQGGVVLGTGIHLLYVAGSFRAVEEIRPLAIHRALEATGGVAFAGLGLAGCAVSGAFLTNFVAHGQFGKLFSAGTVPLLNGAVGLEVTAGVVLLIASFLDQEIVVRAGGGDDVDEQSRSERR